MSVPPDAEPRRRNFLAKRVASVGYAWRGLVELARSETHFQIDLLAMIAVVALGIGFRIEPVEWLAVSLAIGLVLACEAINTALERFGDLVHPERHPDAGRVKDMAAGAVLTAVVSSVAVGVIVFGPRVAALFGRGH